jgi:Zn-dependent M28 family amino/carboxypeptidase
VRLIAWANEEYGGRGSAAYLEANKGKTDKHFAAMESDGGGTHPFGVATSVPAKYLELFKPLQAALLPIGAGLLKREELLGEPDLRGLELAGVPSFGPMVDNASYFSYHHTAADTLDKVDPAAFRRHVAVMAATTWFLANIDTPIGRVPPVPK